MAKSTSKLFGEDKQNVLESPESNVQTEEQEKEYELSAPVDDDIQDVELKVTQKKRFRFNHDNSQILELNTSDLIIVTRLSSSYDKLNKLMDEVGTILSSMPDDEESSDERFDEISGALKKLDDAMRKEIDFIFDAPVSATLCKNGSMYDPIDGMFRYEHIIDKLAELYENNLNREFNKMRQRVNTKTDKYTKKYHK